MSNTPNTPNWGPTKIFGSNMKKWASKWQIIVKIDFFALAAPIGTTGDLFHS